MDKNEVDIHKLQQDLDAVRDVLGCELPFGRDDIRLSLAIAVAAGFWFVWSLFTQSKFWPILVGISPMALVTFGGAFWVWRRGRARRKERPLAAKGVALDMRLMIIFSLAFFGSVVIGLKTGFVRPLFMATVCFWGAVSFLFIGLMGRARRRYLAVALGLGCISPAMYFVYDGPLVAIVAASVALMALADAGIMYVQLRRNRGA